MSVTHSDPKIERIRAVPIFAGASDAALHLLARAADEVTVGSGHDLLQQGHLTAEAYVVESGTAEVVVDGEVVAEIGGGELIGELAFLDPGPATATVRTSSTMTLLVIPHNRLDAIVAESPAMLRAMASELAHRLRQMDERHRLDHRVTVGTAVQTYRQVQVPMLYTAPRR